MFVLFLAMFTKSRPTRCENSTAYTTPSAPIMSETCETVVPEAAPRYKTFEPGMMPTSEMPPTTAAAILERNGLQTLYSILSPFTQTLMRFSLQTLSPGTRFLVTNASLGPLARKMPGRRCCWTKTLGAALKPPGLPPLPLGAPRPPLPRSLPPRQGVLSSLLNYLPIPINIKQYPQSARLHFKSQNMSTTSLLTHNAILYISLGFRQSYTLQVLIKDAQEDCLLLTLYDGMVIIGGKFTFAPNDPLVPKLKNLDVIKLECQFVTLKDPIIIKKFTIVNDRLTSPLGKDFFHLERFLQRQQLFQSSESKEEKRQIQQRPEPQIDLQVEEPKSNPSKRRKENEVQSSAPVLSDLNPKEKPATCLVPNKVAQKVQAVIDLDSDHFITETKVIRVKSLPKSIQREESVSTQRSTNIQPNISRPPMREDIQYISELYEQIQRFKIVCRVNYIANIFTRRGKPATLFMLIDAKGGEIMAKVYESSIEGNIQRQNRIKPQIQLAKTYSFENGEIEKNKDNLLTAVFSWHQIDPVVAFIPSFNISRILTVEGICKLPAEETVSRGIDLSGSQDRVSFPKAKEFAVCGIFCGLNSPPKVINSTYFKASGTLADPEAKKQVNFSIYIHQREGLPEEGSILILHHMRVIADQRTRKIISSNNSYFVNESYNGNPYFKGFSKWINNAEWKSQVYENVSEVGYVSRTIQDLLSILPHLQQMECCYSQIQCRVESLKEKKSYDACSVCNSQVYSNKHTHAYCRTCRQTNLVYKRFIFEVVVVDERGTLEIDLPNDKASSGMHLGKEYLQLPIKDRQEYLQLCKFTPLVLRIESEQQIGGTSHRVISAQKPTMQRVMASIRREAVRERFEGRDSWQ